MNIRGTFTTFAIAAALTTGRAAGPAPTNAPTFTAPPGNPKEVSKEGSYAFGFGMAMSQQWPNHSFVKDMDPEEIARGVKEALRVWGKRADEVTNSLSMRQAQEMYRADVELSGANLMKAGLAYLAEFKKKDGVVTLPDGLEYKVIKEGSGASPEKTNSVVVNYVGKLANGWVFDSTYSDFPKPHGPTTLQMQGVVPGWSEALTLMKPGGRMETAIPGNLGYGARGRRAIPPNSVLIFDIELLSVTNGPPPVALSAPSNQMPPPGMRGSRGGLPPAAPRVNPAPAPRSGAVSSILQVNPDGTTKILPPDATAPAPPAPPAPAPAKP